MLIPRHRRTESPRVVQLFGYYFLAHPVTDDDSQFVSFLEGSDTIFYHKSTLMTVLFLVSSSSATPSKYKQFVLCDMEDTTLSEKSITEDALTS